MNPAALARDVIIAVLFVGCVAVAALMLYDVWLVVLLAPSTVLIADFCLVVAWRVRRHERSGSRHE